MMIRGGRSRVLCIRCRSYENKKHSEWSHASIPVDRNWTGEVIAGEDMELGSVAGISVSLGPSLTTCHWNVYSQLSIILHDRFWTRILDSDSSGSLYK